MSLDLKFKNIITKTLSVFGPQIVTDTISSASGSLSGSALTINQTWNTSGTPTAIKLNVTDSASNAASLLMDLQVGGVSKFNVAKSGSIFIGNEGIITSNPYEDPTANNSTRISLTNGFYGTAGGFGISLYNTNYPQFFAAYSNYIGGYGFWGGSQSTFGFSSSSDTLQSEPDTIIRRDSAGVFAQRNTTNPQEFRLYNTYTDASNYERLSLKANTGGAFTITSEAAGTGVVRNLALMGGNVGIGTTSPTSKLQVKDGDIEVETIASGVILKDSNNVRWRITVNTDGSLNTTSL